MADSNRVSGRQGASTSGRQAGPSVSGRVAAPSASGCAPAQAAAPAVAPRAASSARMAPASARMAPAAPARPSGRKANVSARGGGVDQPKKKGKGKAVGGKELLIAFGVIALLAAVVIFKSMSTNSQIKAVNDAKEAKEQAQIKNYEAAEKAVRAAEDKGALLLVGKEEFDEGKHFGSFKADPGIYNVIYERTYKDKKGEEKHFHKALYPDKLTFMKTGYGKEENGVRINYALAENKTVNVVMGVKNLKLPENDNLNVNAMVTVIVKAPMEDSRFDAARAAKDPSKKVEDAPKDAEKAK